MKNRITVYNSAHTVSETQVIASPLNSIAVGKYERHIVKRLDGKRAYTENIEL